MSNAMTELPAPAVPRGPVALFLDIDGTLVEHRPHPDDVRVDAALHELMAEARHSLGGAVALVTGRSIEMVDRLFSPLLLPAAGIYGLEHRLVEGGDVVKADEPEDLAAVADSLRREFHSVEGIYFERKGPVLAVHTRAAPAIFPRVRVAAERALGRLGASYRIVAGHAGLEFIPVDALKSAAIRRFLEHPPFAGRVPVFIGDDTADEAGFDFVNEAGGLSIRVRPAGPTCAATALPDVAAVHAFIARLATASQTTVDGLEPLQSPA
jgi:trehalose 6-phosphate phosphatase